VLLAVREGLDELARGEGMEVDEADDQMRRELLDHAADNCKIRARRVFSCAKERGCVD
jgi:hypothetical protein